MFTLQHIEQSRLSRDFGIQTFGGQKQYRKIRRVWRRDVFVRNGLRFVAYRAHQLIARGFDGVGVGGILRVLLALELFFG